jgi:hypothetical protein
MFGYEHSIFEKLASLHHIYYVPSIIYTMKQRHLRMTLCKFYLGQSVGIIPLAYSRLLFAPEHNLNLVYKLPNPNRLRLFSLINNGNPSLFPFYFIAIAFMMNVCGYVYFVGLSHVYTRQRGLAEERAEQDYWKPVTLGKLSLWFFITATLLASHSKGFLQMQ